MAMGIDAAAHRGALREGPTVAVLATGVDRCYPERHRGLREDILAAGCIVSEYPPGTKARPHFFLERNRIIAGLARAVIVVESPQRSGALATARSALEANRDVLVAPGALGDPQFAGSNALIREGATLVQTFDDIRETLGDIIPAAGALPPADATPFHEKLHMPEREIVTLLKQHGALSIDKLVELSKLSTHVVSRSLTMLVLSHAIIEINNRYALAP
jgi:DNA processing protein